MFDMIGGYELATQAQRVMRGLILTGDGADPALDAARLDIMHSRLLGRAAGVRPTRLYIFQAIAPPLFGWVSGVFGGRGSGAGQPGAQQGNPTGLDITFLIMLVTLGAAGLVMFRALKTYPRDVATAIASEQACRTGRETSNAKCVGF